MLILGNGKKIELEDFKSVKPLGFGDTGKLCGIDQYVAMKAMDKGVMLNRNKMDIEVTAPFDGAFDFMDLCYDIGFYFERNMLFMLDKLIAST
ncbi:phototropin-1 [Cucumis melo var. makuwa]|uniref:Phototropin-1 n=1 Tax=Cucumis melo var. makuwa TaxID=1194695 RepID=A0A5D3CDL1_CUCMM|nr:phototropin-1 [Cucumis melo var. makuwa]